MLWLLAQLCAYKALCSTLLVKARGWRCCSDDTSHQKEDEMSVSGRFQLGSNLPYFCNSKCTGSHAHPSREQNTAHHQFKRDRWVFRFGQLLTFLLFSHQCWKVSFSSGKSWTSSFNSLTQSSRQQHQRTQFTKCYVRARQQRFSLYLKKKYSRVFVVHRCSFTNISLFVT